MSNTEQQIEQEIQSKNLNAPRLTPDHIDSKIKNIYCDIFTDEEIKFYKINFIEPNTMNEILEIDIWQLTEN